MADLLSALEAFHVTAVTDDSIAECLSTLQDFASDNANAFSFAAFPVECRKKLVDLLSQTALQFHRLSLACLQCLKLVSRDRNIALSMQTVNGLVSALLQFICSGKDSDFSGLPSVRAESLRCLCNFVYHCSPVRDFLKDDTVLLNHLQETFTSCANAYAEDMFYCIRLVFLMSALETTERDRYVRTGFVRMLVGVLENAADNFNFSCSEEAKQKDLLAEILKTLFNVTLSFSGACDQQAVEDGARLVALVRRLIIMFSPYPPASYDLLSHLCHTLVNVPKEATKALLPEVPFRESQSSKPRRSQYPVEYELHDMTAVIILIEELEKRMQLANQTLMKDTTMPILTGFCYLCRVNRVIRKFLKQEIAPLFKISDKRPEEFDSLHGKIVRLMTNVDVPLKNMAADFLFVLCKENTNRLIRYAGYGNCAGFLAARGLMIPGMSSADGDYSTDDESDLDDVGEDVDVVTGAKAKAREDVFANLTEEEKEKEACNLMAMIGKLTDLNVVKPMTVGPDGRLTEMSSEELRPEPKEGT